jgi:hypothetical protein
MVNIWFVHSTAAVTTSRHRHTRGIVILRGSGALGVYGLALWRNITLVHVCVVGAWSLNVALYMTYAGSDNDNNDMMADMAAWTDIVNSGKRCWRFEPDVVTITCYYLVANGSARLTLAPGSALLFAAHR